MNQLLSDSRLANIGANTVLDGFETYMRRFHEITRRAKIRFENRDWAGMQVDAAERLEMQEQAVTQTVNQVGELLEGRSDERLVWASVKAVYSGLIARQDNWELAETFFNSVSRRVFPRSGVDPQLDFVDTDFDVPPTKSKQLIYKTYTRSASVRALIRSIIKDANFEPPFEDLQRDVDLVATQIKATLKEIGALQVIEWAEIIRSVFFRRRAAYIMGRLHSGSHVVPFVLAFRHQPEGIVIDAVLLDENDISVLTSFSRSYFHVDAERPYDLVRFLRLMMPRKRVAELYISLGFNKHGKTELYRDILHHVTYTQDKFDIARGQRGMVMIAFTMPSFDMLIKIIKDRFDPPKRTDHQAVKDKYHLVFMHDRAGRLIDAQQFEQLRFRRSNFTEDLLAELLQVASQTVSLEGDYVVIQHAYIERRIIPLNLYVNEADEEAARQAVIDYGQAIKDLAATNIFPGDLLTKNFGVSRHGRVIFYDYDEIMLLTDCKFKRFPPARFYEDDMMDVPHFGVDDDDIYPEQFPQFLGLRDELYQVFVQHHADLFDADYWRNVQVRVREDNPPPIYPYFSDRRLSATIERGGSG
ncbi:MAG TPA: bifunctional isocitrate dehydrogenase kinase/phosphatase [Anaerolineae bacterium]|nr:bifunctional isocitrate dehydrogenase kinase/phosphatase [Anaerolineae bacterium]HMR65828.1 bifunctional isocitrate dehydrogenase kinase/phosphatase [Anaerolineae bacterium]